MTQDLKDERARKQALTTRYLNMVNRNLADHDRDEITENLKKVKDYFKHSEIAHYNYFDLLEDDELKAVEEEWFLEKQNSYLSIVRKARTWLNDSNINLGSEPADLVSILSAPNVKLDPFKGDPLEFQSFMAIFDELVGDSTLLYQGKLTRLIQATKGDAKSAIKSCSLIGCKSGYETARSILNTRSGNSHVIARHIINDLTVGKNFNAKEISQFSDHISAAKSTLEKIDMLSEIDTQQSIVNMIQRCPHFVKIEWRKKALACKEKSGAYPDFATFSKFMSGIAANINDPLYGNSSYFPKSDKKGSGSALQTHVSPRPEPRPQLPCPLCNVAVHNLFKCDKFIKMKQPERFKFVKDKNLCFNCFYSNHKTDKCRLKSMCNAEGCKYKHSYLLHFTDETSVKSIDAAQADVSVNSTCNNHSYVYIPIVKVLINQKVEAWALLDSGSTNSFITKKLGSQLNLNGKKVTYTISTVNDCQEVESKLFTFNASAAKDKTKFVTMSNVLQIDNIPANFPTVKLDLNKYPEFSDLNIEQPEPGTTADILIGMDNANLLMPLHVRSCEAQGEPYLIQTELGWAICGTKLGKYANTVMSNCVGVDRNVNEFWDLEDCNENSNVSSFEDRKVLKLWDENVKFEDGKYELPIPWKDGSPALPNNRFVAEKRLNLLRKRLDRENLVSKYSENIYKMFTSGYAEIVPEDEITLSDGSAWFLPHHPVISAAKPDKVRPVFDCAAKYNKVSLNNQCFQGPDLVNKLHVLLKF